jgi:probable F420-dependent oxidoreductase
MKIGVPLTVDPRDVPDLARRAEDAGAESLWIFEHLIWPVEYRHQYPYTEDGLPPVPSRVPTYDAWVYLASVAAVTDRVRLGTSVYILPLRDPLVTGRAVATLDVVSNGRAILGAGVGWLAEEFEIEGIDFASRGRRTDEIVEVLRSLWSDDVTEYHGEHIDLPPVYFEPKPPQGRALPILFGGESAVALRRAARLGDGWIGMRHTPESARARADQLAGLRATAGRGDDPFEVTIGASWPLDAERLEAFRDAGVNRVSVRPWRRGQDWREGIDELGELLA